MGTGGPRRQRGARGLGEGELDDAVRHVTTSRDLEVDLRLRGLGDPALAGGLARRLAAAAVDRLARADRGFWPIGVRVTIIFV